MPDMAKEGVPTASSTVKHHKKKDKKNQARGSADKRAEEAAGMEEQPEQGQATSGPSREGSPVPGHPLKPQPPHPQQEVENDEDMQMHPEEDKGEEAASD